MKYKVFAILIIISILSLLFLKLFLKISFKKDIFSSLINNIFSKDSLSFKTEITFQNDLFKKQLFPETIIEDQAIDNFYLPLKSSKIIYLSKNQIFLFDRKTKEKEEIYQLKQTPEEIILPINQKEIREILIKTPKDVLLVFLTPTIQKDLSLNKILLNAFKNSDLKNLETNPQILQIDFHPFLENTYLIKTQKGIYSYSFLNDKLELIYFGPSSYFFSKNDHLYFIKENGVIASYSLKDKKETNSSFYSFFNQNYLKIKIYFNQSLTKKDFIAIDENEKAYYFDNLESPTPHFLGERIKKAFLFEDKIFLIKELAGKYSAEIFDPSNKSLYDLNIFLDTPEIYLIKNQYLIFSYGKKLILFDLLTHQSKNLGEDEIKNAQFFYDSSLNYLYYLTNSQIKRVSLF